VLVCTLFSGVAPPRCADAGKTDFSSVFNTVLYGARNMRPARRFYAGASISTPRPYTAIFDLVLAV
jgi:hypothetical protein